MNNFFSELKRRHVDKLMAGDCRLLRAENGLGARHEEQVI